MGTLNVMLLGTKDVLSVASTIGCRPSMISRLLSSLSSGLQ